MIFLHGIIIDRETTLVVFLFNIAEEWAVNPSDVFEMVEAYSEITLLNSAPWVMVEDVSEPIIEAKCRFIKLLNVTILFIYFTHILVSGSNGPTYLQSIPSCNLLMYIKPSR